MASAVGILLVGDPGLLADVTAEVLSGAGHCVDRVAPSAATAAWCPDRHGLAVVVTDGLFGVAVVLGELHAVGANVLGVSEQDGAAVVRQLVLLGATSVFASDGSPAMLLATAALTSEGISVLGHGAAALILAEWRLSAGMERAGAGEAAELTTREMDVLEALAAGLATKAVARRLGVTLKTVESHKANLFTKLGVRTQAQAVAVALHTGLVKGAASSPGQDGRSLQ